MVQVNFAYGSPANDAADGRVALSLFGDRAHDRAGMADDLEAAGFRVAQSGPLAALLEVEPAALGEVVMLDCPQVDAARMAALMRLDMRVAQMGMQLIIVTSLAALDDVFACFDQSAPQILVAPSRAELVVALGHALARLPGGQVRELSEDDRLLLLRLAEQVAQIAARMDRLDPPAEPSREGGGLFRLESPGQAFRPAPADGTDRLVRAARPPLPDPRLVRRIIRQRQLRARFFDGELFADPAWDMMLDLTAARVEHQRVSVTSLCIASGVPPTTALRWIGQMVDAGLFERVEDESDRRRAFIQLSDRAADGMARYFAELGRSAATLV